MSCDWSIRLVKAIIFDFDGVIVESADIKTEAFKELFADYPEKIEEIVRYHTVNAGISRFVKFQYIYEQILKKDLPKDEESKLGKRFSQIVFKKILNAPFVAGAKEFLEAHTKKYQFFIASGTPEEELYEIIAAKGLKAFFDEILGSPKTKVDIINEIIHRYGFAKNEIVFIGDAQSDKIAAKKARVVFIERRLKLDSKSKIHPLKISNLFDLGEILIEMKS